ncbi:hypothetical protein BJ546DRAFT_995657 [Cryomyces antarcticus]
MVRAGPGLWARCPLWCRSFRVFGPGLSCRVGMPRWDAPVVHATESELSILPWQGRVANKPRRLRKPTYLTACPFPSLSLAGLLLGDSLGSDLLFSLGGFPLFFLCLPFVFPWLASVLGFAFRSSVLVVRSWFSLSSQSWYVPYPSKKKQQKKQSRGLVAVDRARGMAGGPCL